MSAGGLYAAYVKVSFTCSAGFWTSNVSWSEVSGLISSSRRAASERSFVPGELILQLSYVSFLCVEWPMIEFSVMIGVS